jgi:hypothetical protein
MINTHADIEVLKAVMTMLIFWYVTPCRLVGRDRRFEEKYFVIFSAENSCIPTETDVGNVQLSLLLHLCNSRFMRLCEWLSL